jgi:hypothetical protein
MEIYRYSNKSSVLIIDDLLIPFLGILITVGANYYYPSPLIVLLIYYSCIYFFINMMATLNLFYEYRERNIATVLFVDAANCSMTIEEFGDKTTFAFSQIQNIKLIISRAWLSGNEPGGGPWEEFQCAIITIDGGQKFIVTTLIKRNLRKMFDNLKLTYNLKRKYYPRIK